MFDNVSPETLEVTDFPLAHTLHLVISGECLYDLFQESTSASGYPSAEG